MAAFAIEPMTEGDLAAAVAIDLASFPEDVHGGGAPRLAREGQLREELARTWARVRVAREGEGGEILGYVVFWHVADELHVLNVAVAPGARRRGVGRALVGDVIAYARSHAAARIILEVRASNRPAIALYGGLGFAEFNVRARYYSDGEDGVEMMLVL